MEKVQREDPNKKLSITLTNAEWKMFGVLLHIASASPQIRERFESVYSQEDMVRVLKKFQQAFIDNNAK